MPLDFTQHLSHQQRRQHAQQWPQQHREQQETHGEERQQGAQRHEAEAATPASYLSRWVDALALGKLSTWLLAVVLLAAVPVLVVQVHSELEQRERRRGEIAEQVQRSAELVAARIHRLVDNAQVVLATVGRLPKIEARDRTRASMS